MTSRRPLFTEGGATMMKNGIRPVHPGKRVLEEFMKPSDPPIHANTLGKTLDVRGIGSHHGRYGGEPSRLS